MIKLDSYVDTKDKRQCIFHILYLLITFWLLFSYLKTAGALLFLHSYEDMFSALADPALDSSYLARFILQAMSMSELQWFRLCEIAVTSLRSADIWFLLWTLAVFITDTFQKVRRRYIMMPAGYFLLFMTAGILGILASNAESFTDVIQYVRLIGWSILIIQLFLALWAGRCLYRELKLYISALAYHAVEIRDEKDTE